MAESRLEKIKRIMANAEKIRNIGVCAHIDHGKTTFSDNLLAGAGMISKELAGDQLALDFHEDEQERGITIDSASVSMVHDFKEDTYLINLIDTPGHVDFSGDVTRAMRAVDGAIVLACAVEGIMPQTETVLRQALKERVKPVLFINKVDRCIKELQLTPEQMQERFVKIIAGVNKLIRNIAEEEFAEKWQVNVNDGSVAFGSAYHNWALSVPYMKEKGITFADVIEAYKTDTHKELAEKAPLHLIVLNMCIEHHPDPRQAQKYRIAKIWHGDVDSEVGKGLMNCDPAGPIVFVCTKIVVDKHAGEVAAGRLFSGTINQGQEVYQVMGKRSTRVQQVSVYNGPKREPIDKVSAGNIVGLVGLKNVFSGETVSVEDIEPFEEIKHIFEPVITKAIEAKRAADLPKLVEVLKQVNKEDPTLSVEINEETGENLISGMGELHLEVIENRIVANKGIEVKTSPPIVVYRETVTKLSPVQEGKSPNKHNKFYIKVEPLSDELYNAIRKGEISERRVKKKDVILVEQLKKFGLEADEGRKVKDIYNGNILIDLTRGIVHLSEIIEIVLDSFEDVIRNGPIAKEPVTKLKISLMDVKLHEDAIHRGPAQIIPSVRESLKLAMNSGGPVLFEPLQLLQFDAPIDYMGNLSKLVQNRRGQLLDMTQEREMVTIKAKMPVGEMFGLSNDLRSATNGRGTQALMDQMFERLPMQLQKDIIRKIRERKGLSTEE